VFPFSVNKFDGRLRMGEMQLNILAISCIDIH
jgi:hypothetical protein